MSFHDENKTLQELVRELMLLRKHNQAQKDVPAASLLFAEAALVLMTLERFLRILPGVNTSDRDTLPTLLQRAVAIKVLVLPDKGDMEVIHQIRKIRNSIIHANFEQAAKECGLKTVAEYFKTQFAPELEALFQLTIHLIEQIDPETGFRKA